MAESLPQRLVVVQVVVRDHVPIAEMADGQIWTSPSGIERMRVLDATISAAQRTSSACAIFEIEPFESRWWAPPWKRED